MLAQKKTGQRKENESMKESHLQKEGISMISFFDFKTCGPHRSWPEGLFIERTAGGVLTSATYWLCSEGQHTIYAFKLELPQL